MGRPTVLLHYYTLHAGSSWWWDTDEGSRGVVEISRHLEAIGFRGYWSGNDVVRPYFRHRLHGSVECQPKMAGTNSLRHHTQCAFLYSSKAQSADDVILEILGLDRSDIRRAREDEDIIQFFGRGAIRDRDFRGTYEAHLYSKDQAERLKEYLISNGITDDVRLVPVQAAGIMDVQRPEQDRARSVVADPATNQARADRLKEKNRERAQRNRDRSKAVKVTSGNYRPRGRPKKAA